MTPTTEPTPARRYRPETEPLPPDLRLNQGTDLAAVLMTFNGVQYRAMLAIRRGRVEPAAVAAMLEGMAREIRRVGA